jgi:hypothetical protein
MIIGKNIVLVCNLCSVKASPNRRGADEGGGEVNVLLMSGRILPLVLKSISLQT